jgi:hypothetical protein
MSIANDWTVDKENRLVQHTAGTTVYTVNELYTHLSALSDDTDFITFTSPMRASTPDIYLWVNGWSMTDEVSYQYLKSGSLQDAEGGDIYANVQTIGTLVAGSNIFMYRTDGTAITTWWQPGHIDILLKVQENDVLISSGTVEIFIRDYGNEYDIFTLDASTKRINTVALATGNDFSNNTDAGTVGGYTDISFTFGAISRDLLNGAGPQSYDLELDCNNRPVTEVFEYSKLVTAITSSYDMDGVPGERYISVDPGTFSIDKKSPLGTFAGGKWFLAQGVWLKNYQIADEENFQLIDSSGNTQNPPLNIGFGLSGLQTGSRIMIYNSNTGATVASYENTGTSILYRYTYSADIPVRIVIMHLDYKYEEVFATMGDTDIVLPISQTADPLYLDDAV